MSGVAHAPWLPVSGPRSTGRPCNLPVYRGRDNWRYVPIGTTRICRRRGGCKPVVRVKVSDAGSADRRWTYLSKVVWEAAHGALPAGWCLWHRNLNQIDCRLENLEAITRAERLRRNIANNRDKCRAIWASQAARLGRLHWRAGLDARRVKAARKRFTIDH